MELIAKLFINGRSQAVRLPAAFRFDTKEVFIRRDAATGDLILSRRPGDWAGFFAVAQPGAAPDFLDATERAAGHADERSDPLGAWRE